MKRCVAWVQFKVNPKAPITTAADDKFCDIFPNFMQPIAYFFNESSYSCYLYFCYPLAYRIHYGFDLIIYVPSTIFQLCRDGSSLVEPLLSLAQGHNAVTAVRLAPTATWPRVKYSTIEPLRSLEDSLIKFMRKNLQLHLNYDLMTNFFPFSSLL